MSFTQVLTILKIVMQLVPVLIEVIKAIETAIPGQGLGEQKLAAVREIIQKAYESVNDNLPTFVQAWPMIEQAVSSLVQLFNRTGVFAK